ncbi:hypothetical protein EDB19DRAFT_1914813 [Suillus lakei]|nr:hypothetical protein EDB19DRAFT_1914813 [Suillus lakei]
MAPKCVAKPAKAPHKNAKVGAILSGISRAGPADMDMGSMVSGQSTSPPHLPSSLQSRFPLHHPFLLLQLAHSFPFPLHRPFLLLQLARFNDVDVMVAFGGLGTLPSMISNTVRSFILEIGVFSRSDVWLALCEMLASSNDILDYTTVVVMFANTIKGQCIVECRQISKDIPGVRAFGYKFKSCGTPGCHPTPADMCVYNRNEKVLLQCLKCLWRSANVKTDWDNVHFKRVNKVLSPRLFWHYYPASTALQNYFVEVTTGMTNAHAATSSHTGKGKKGVDKKNGKHQDIAADIKQDSEMVQFSPGCSLPMDLD